MEQNINTQLAKVIGIDINKCVNCHSCITVCPVKFCNNTRNGHMSLNADMCIACGSCIKACTHEARYHLDDFSNLLHDLKNGTKIVAVVSPSIAANFNEKYLNINGWLKHIGVEAVFDISFGAELASRSYLELIQKSSPQATIISQTCTSIVSYIELYRPELIKYLAPIDSPTVHTIKMIREYYPEFNNHKIAILSPCSAQKRENMATGLGDYSIAIKSIDAHFKDNKINLDFYPKEEYTNPPPERAILFLTPGGLQKTLERSVPEIRNKTRRMVGKEAIYPYLDKLSGTIKDKKAAFLIDCLNCTNGCNAGALTLFGKESSDEIEYWLQKRNLQMQELYRKQGGETELAVVQEIDEKINAHWKENLYSRNYTNRWENVKLQYPTEAQLREIFSTMRKKSNQDFYNCSSCGYGNCKDMAMAIFNDLNRVENCHFYLLKDAELSNADARKSERHLRTMISNMQDAFIQVDPDGIITHTNPAMKKLLKKNDIVGRKLFDFLDEKNELTLRNQMEIRAQNIESTYELTLTQSDGKKIFTRISASPLFDDNKRRIGSFAMLADITPLKKFQEELEKINHELESRVEQRTAELTEMVEELKSTTELIEESNQKLEKLSIVAQKTDNAIFIMDPLGNIEWVNDGFSKMYGCSFDELAKQKGINIIEISNLTNIKEIVKNCVFDKETITYENSPDIKTANGVWSQTTLTPILDDNGNIKNLVAIDSNITELKKAEESILQQKEEITSQTEMLEKSLEALKESEQKLSDIIDFLPDAAFVIDKDRKIIAWNKSIEKMTGVPAKDMLGKNNYEYAIPFYGKRRPVLIDLVFASDNELKKHYTSISKKSNVLTAESYVPQIRNSELFMQASASPLFNAEGEIDGAIEIIRDVTEWRKDTENLREAYAKLQEQKDEITEQSKKMTEMFEELQISSRIIEGYNRELEKLSIVASETDNAVLIMDKGQEVKWINGAFTRRYGYKLSDLKNGNAQKFFKPEVKSAINQALCVCIEKKRSTTFESLNQTKEGAEIWAHTTLTPIFNEKSELIQLVAIDSDITELKKAQREILQQKEEIESQRDHIQIQHDIAASQRDLFQKQKKDITDSIQYASRIQSALLPSKRSFASVFKEYFVFYKPRDIVSGDFYWLKKMDNLVFFTAADSTGHGVPGAFVSLLGITLLNEIANKLFSSVEDIKVLKASTFLDKLRKRVIHTLHHSYTSEATKDGMDMAFCILDTDTNRLQYAGAHNPLFIIRNQELISIKADKMPIGIHGNKENIAFTNHEIQLQPNDCIYIFTDGYADQFGGNNGSKFFLKNLRDVLCKNYHRTMPEQKDILEETIANWMKAPNHDQPTYSQIDDMLIIGIRI